MILAALTLIALLTFCLIASIALITRDIAVERSVHRQAAESRGPATESRLPVAA